MRRVVIALSVIGLVWAGSPAHASQWVPPVYDPVIALSFGAEYSGRVHRGIDLSAETGAEVRTPSSGTIVFAGTVPADGGGTCNAVTIETSDGHRISLLPLEGVCVSKGASVSAGDPVGRLAASGDDSTSGPHVHLGLRSGDRYVDPAPMLPITPAAGPDHDSEERGSPPVPGGDSVADPASEPISEPVPTPIPVPAATPVQTPASASAPSAAPQTPPATIPAAGPIGEPASTPTPAPSATPVQVPGSTVAHGSAPANAPISGSVSAPAPRTASASVRDLTSAEVAAPVRMVDAESLHLDDSQSVRLPSVVRPMVSSSAVAEGPVRVPAVDLPSASSALITAHLIQDAGTSASAPVREPARAVGEDGSSRWVRSPRQASFRVVPGVSLFTLVTALGAVVPLIARSKAFVRVR